MRKFAAVLLLGIVPVAFAQTGDMSAKKERLEQAKAKLEQKFNEADANHDGKLTREEADGKMPRVYKMFDEIDTEKNGYVTLEQIGHFAMGKMAARRAQRGG